MRYYAKVLARNDSAAVAAVPYRLTVPTGGVALGTGSLNDEMMTSAILALRLSSTCVCASLYHAIHSSRGYVSR